MKSFTPAETRRLIALEAQMDQVLFGQHYDEKTGKMVDDCSILPTVATIGGVGAAGYGGYKGVQAVSDKIDALGTSKTKGGLAVNAKEAKTFRNSGALNKVGTAGKEVGKDMLEYIKDVGSKLKNRVFDAGTSSRLTELSAKLDKALG